MIAGCDVNFSLAGCTVRFDEQHDAVIETLCQSPISRRCRRRYGLRAIRTTCPPRSPISGCLFRVPRKPVSHSTGQLHSLKGKECTAKQCGDRSGGVSPQSKVWDRTLPNKNGEKKDQAPHRFPMPASEVHWQSSDFVGKWRILAYGMHRFTKSIRRRPAAKWILSMPTTSTQKPSPTTALICVTDNSHFVITTEK